MLRAKNLKKGFHKKLADVNKYKHSVFTNLDIVKIIVKNIASSVNQVHPGF